MIAVVPRTMRANARGFDWAEASGKPSLRKWHWGWELGDMWGFSREREQDVRGDRSTLQGNLEGSQWGRLSAGGPPGMVRPRISQKSPGHPLKTQTLGLTAGSLNPNLQGMGLRDLHSFPLSRFCYFEKYQTCREIESKVQGTLEHPSPRFTDGEHFGTFLLFFLLHWLSPWQASPKDEGRRCPPWPRHHDHISGY